MIHMPTASETYSKGTNVNCGMNRGRSSSRSSSSSSSKKGKPFLFLSNMLSSKKKKILEIDDILFDREMNQRTKSEPSGIAIE